MLVSAIEHGALVCFEAGSWKSPSGFSSKSLFGTGSKTGARYCLFLIVALRRWAMVPPVIKRKYMAEMKKAETLEEVLSFTRPDFVRDILFTKEGFGLKPVVFTPTTRKLGPDEQVPSVSTKLHLPYFDDHPFIPKLIKYQKIAKLRNTYVGLPEHTEVRTTRGEQVTVTVGPTGFWQYLTEDDYIHPSFILHRTVTGRSSSHPGSLLTRRAAIGSG